VVTEDRSLFLEIINDIIYMVRLGDGDYRQARIEYINSRIERLTGYDSESFLKDPALWMRIIHPEDIRRVLLSVLRMIRGKREVLREHRILTKKGSYIWVEDKFIPIVEKDKVIGFIGIARDITRRKVLEDISLLALKEEPQKLFETTVRWIREIMNADLVAV